MTKRVSICTEIVGIYDPVAHPPAGAKDTTPVWEMGRRPGHFEQSIETMNFQQQHSRWARLGDRVFVFS